MNAAKKLPDRWSTARLGDLVSVVIGGTPSRQRPELWENRKHAWVTVRDLHGGEITNTRELISDAGVSNSSVKLLPRGTPLVSFKLSLGKVGIAGLDLYTNEAVAGLIPKDETKIAREYLFFLFQHIDLRSHARSAVKGKTVNKQILENLEIPVPPLKIQAVLVAILQKASDVRRKHIEARRISKKLLPTIFLEMFGDPRANPMGWPKKSLESVSDVRQGVAKGRDLRGRESVTAPYLRVANVQESYLDLTEVKEIYVLPSDLEKYRLERGDVLLTEGGDPDKLGRGFVWNDEIQGCIYQNHIFRVRVDRRVLLPEFLAFLTSTPYAKEYFLKAAKRSSNLASINASQLRSFSVPLPPIGIQERFRDAFNAASQRLLTSEATATADALYARLLAAAFSGQIVA